MWSVENHSVHHCVCTAVKGGDLVHCGNSCLQDRSCETAQESRCAIEQERRYSSLGHLHQKKKEKREHELSVHLWWIMCSHTLVKTTEPKNLYSGSSAALRGHQDSGMSLAWAVFDSTSAFSIVTASTPQVPVAVEIFAGVAFLLQGPAEAVMAQHGWQPGLWGVTLCLCWVLKRLCLPAALWTLWLKVMNGWSVKRPRNKPLIQLWMKLA